MAQENEEYQKLGCVALNYVLDFYKTKYKYPATAAANGVPGDDSPNTNDPTGSMRSGRVNYEGLRQVIQLFAYVPIRFVAIYRLSDKDGALSKVAEFAQFVMGKFQRLRSRSVVGTYAVAIVPAFREGETT